MKKYSK
jgi:hypothetical protein